jgi:hypothetical protein
MYTKIIFILILIINKGVSYSQSIGSQLIGSVGETIQSESGISLTFSVGEPIVDYYKCTHHYRIGFIQSPPIMEQTEILHDYERSLGKVAQIPNRVSGDFKGDEKYILFDAAGRVIQRGINFRKNDPAIQFPYPGIYFVQTSIDNKNVRVEKILFAR